MQSVNADRDVYLHRSQVHTSTKTDARMLNELIQKIEVHQSEKLEGVQIQRLTIHYNCVGTLDIPKEPTLETPKVILQTRKGVRVAYEPSDAAG